MSVRVVARVRPLQQKENDKDVIVQVQEDADSPSTRIRVPNPKNFAENYTFDFNRVYGQHATQQEIFEAEGEALTLHEV